MTFDRYLLRNFWHTFAVCFATLFGLVVVIDLFENLDEFIMRNEDRGLASLLERIGWFECSDPLINRLHQNVVWGMRGNFLDVPTDCPQRDERLGWTGDLQVFSPTATFLYNVGGLLKSWLADLAVEQCKSGGRVPHVIPNVQGKQAAAAAAWGPPRTRA